jgi:hypothetical protein
MMIKTRTLILLLSISITLTVGLLSIKASQDIQASHIEGNVPDEKEFDAILKRDLEKYFSDPGKRKIQVSYELFRRTPTQTGVAYPKFYLWVTISINGKPVEEGAARVAAIDKKEFEVINYLKKEDIKRNSAAVHQTFPQALCEKILEKARE